MQLILGDCLYEMDRLIEQGRKVDLILTDPPYGTTRNTWDSVIPFEPMWERIKKLRKDSAPTLLFGSEPFSSLLRVSNLKYKYDWVWNKSQVTGFLNAKKRPLVTHELISVFYSPQCPYFPQMTKGKMQLKNTGGGTSNYNSFIAQPHYSDEYYPKSIISFPQVRVKGGHPTQKPVALLEYLIMTYTRDGETVLDFTMGSGSTGIACLNTGRNFIGIELDDKYYKIAKERIEAMCETSS